MLLSSCSDNNETGSSVNDPGTNQNPGQSSPYYGWFKDKSEFSFKTVSVTEGETNGMQIRNTVTSYFYVKGGKEAVREVSVTELNGASQNETEKIYITSADANYVINPGAKTYFQEGGDPVSVMYSKVWVWTRKKSDSYDAVSVNTSAQKSTSVISSVNVDCYDISGVQFCFDAEKKLLRYEGDAGGMHTVTTFSDYQEGSVPDFIEECIADLESDGYTAVSSQFGV